MVHYLFLLWNLPWITLACYGRQLKKKKKKKKQTIKPRSDAVVIDIRLIRMYTVWELIYQIWDRQTVLIKTKKKRKKTGAFKRCILLSLSVKPTFDLLDRPTAPGVLQTQCIHTCHTNGFIIRLPLLMIHTKDSEVLIFWQCLDNDVINLCCSRLPLCVSPIYMSNDRLEPLNYHTIAFKRCADVVSMGRHAWPFVIF